jgi:hypothetical protein
MKLSKSIYIISLACLSAIFVSCSKNDDTVSSVPVIESLTVTSPEALLSDSIRFDAKVSDEQTPLSTLEVNLSVNDSVISHKSIRTKGNSVDLKNMALAVPFLRNIKEGDEMNLSFTLINIDGSEANKTMTIKAKRPSLPTSLFAILRDKTVIELTQSADDPNIYESEEDDYGNTFNVKVATSNSLAKSQYIWNGTNQSNQAIIGNISGADIKFAFSDYLVKKIIFNACTFQFSIEGININVQVNGTRLMADGDFLKATIAFTKGQAVTITGIDDVQGAYNRDFFSYDATKKTCTFTGESGNWEVYYSYKYNYIWVNKMDDVAPASYWIIGSGFTSMPRWSDDYPGDWNLDDVLEVAYLKRLSESVYQAHVYLSDEFDMQIFSNRTWDAKYAVFSGDRFSGDSAGFKAAGSVNADIVNDDTFTPGYYCVTMDISQGLDKAAVKFERVSD